MPDQTSDGPMPIPAHDPSELQGGVTRRTLVTRAAQIGAAAATGAALLSACGSSSTSSSSSAGANAGPHGLSALPGGTPKQGGTFNVGVLSGGNTETLWPGLSAINADWVRQYSLFNLLFYCGPEINPIEPGLALSASVSTDGKTWTFHLRPGVTWHDGTPFTADDVVYNFQSVWSNPENDFYGFLHNLVNFKSARAVNTHTVSVGLTQAVAEFPKFFTWQNSLIVQKGATEASTAKHPIGTGPFKFVSFTPGQQSVFTANKEYWEEGKPYVDTLVVKSSFTDPSTVFNALQSGAVNLVPALLPTQARSQLSEKSVQVLEAPPFGQVFGFCMRVDQGPFADNRVRMGFKLLADRQALLDGAVSGFGSPAYDIMGSGCQYFASDLTRTQDVEQAKSLFKAAGVSGQTFTLQTAPAIPGMVESATLLAQQAQAAGIKVAVQQLSAATYFTPAAGYTKRYFGHEVTEPNAALAELYRALVITDAPFDDTHWGAGPSGAQRTAMINAAIADLNSTTAQEKWHAIQLQQFNQGGFLWWGNIPFLDAAATNVRGLKTSAGFNFNNWRLLDGWID